MMQECDQGVGTFVLTLCNELTLNPWLLSRSLALVTPSTPVQMP